MRTFKPVTATARIELLEAEVRELKAHAASQAAYIRALERCLHARRSERFVPAGDEQLNLFAEVDEHVDLDEPTDSGEPARAVTRHPGRNALPAHFPLEVEVVCPGEEAERGAFGEAKLKRDGHVLIGYETSERVEYRPAQYVRVLQKRPTYRCLATGLITTAHARDRVLARSIADETLAVDVILKKFLDHQPLYRQAEILERDHGWALSPATMGKWTERVAVTLRPLYDALVARIVAADYVQMDESGIRVLAADKPGASHRGWMWLVRDPTTGAVALRYDRSRAAKVPAAVLEGYSGVLQTDGYRAYAKALTALRVQGAEIRRVGCLAHVRRKFFEAKESDPAARQALSIIQRVYALEARWRDLSAAERLAERRASLAPVFAELTDWLERYRHAPVPKTPLGKAIGYARAEWPTLAAVLEDGRIEVDNNGIENEVRPLALGRKNYLFAGDHGAAENIAVLYSLLLSCRAAGVNPRAWLNDTLGRILQHPVNRIAELLPHNYRPDPQDGVG